MQTNEFCSLYNISDLFLDDFDSDNLFVSPPERVPPIPPREEVKEVKELKILASKKLLSRLPIKLAQIKARNNSNKLKKRNQTNLLYQHNKITKKVCNNLIKSL